MVGTGRSLGVLVGSLLAANGMADAQRPAMPASPPAMRAASPSGPMMTAPTRIVLSEVVDPAHRDSVLAVVRKPTIATRGTFDDILCTPAVYDWLLEHPDRTSLAWQRLKVPCVAIKDAGNGRFSWADGDGSELTWQPVGRFPDGLVLYATGKVKPSVATPSVPVRAVVVLTQPKRPIGNGTAVVSPAVQAFLQTDSRAAKVVMRLLGPAAPRLAEQGAEQLLFFFAGIARYVQTHPDEAEQLLAPPK
jgi:hypothetical protein